MMENETKAYCEPKLDASILDDEQLAILISKCQPKSKWAEIFSALESGSLPDWLSAPVRLADKEILEKHEQDGLDTLDIQSPKAASDCAGIFAVFPSLSLIGKQSCYSNRNGRILAGATME